MEREQDGNWLASQNSGAQGNTRFCETALFALSLGKRASQLDVHSRWQDNETGIYPTWQRYKAPCTNDVKPIDGDFSDLADVKGFAAAQILVGGNQGRLRQCIKSGKGNELLWSDAQSQTVVPGKQQDFEVSPQNKSGEGNPSTLSKSNSSGKNCNTAKEVIEIFPSGVSFIFKTAWKRSSETADALSLSHTSKTDLSPPLPTIKEYIHYWR